MLPGRFAISILAGSALIACSPEPTAPVSLDLRLAKSASGSTDPGASWKLPLAAAGLALRSDGQFSDGTYSVYANGVCNVSATIFATTQKSNSGDATIQTNGPGKGKSCARTFNVLYPDGFSETVPSFNNLRKLQNTTTIIPLGATVKRQLILNPGVMGASRCDRLLFGIGDSGNGVGSDSVLVTRVNARTWQVQSDGEHNLAWCQKTEELFVMPVNLVIVADRDLP